MVLAQTVMNLQNYCNQEAIVVSVIIEVWSNFNATGFNLTKVLPTTSLWNMIERVSV